MPTYPPNSPAPQGDQPDHELLAKLQELERDNAAHRSATIMGPSDLSPLAADVLHRLVVEKARRAMEALRLYEPLDRQLAFHWSPARVRVARGSNRAGKTLSAAVEVARAVTGQDPYDRYPKSNGRAFLIGKDLKHIGEVMWRKLARAGAFKMIRDKVTGIWRSFRPWNLEDQERADEAKVAPPLIPPRMIKEIGWENKRENVPSVVRLRNGWELSFFSSLGKPPQGSDIDLVWLDEEIVDEEWYPEMSARILDRKGRLIWSATPQAGTDQLYELHERAEEDRGKKAPNVEEFIILLEENRHIGEMEKRLFAESLSEEDRKVRIGGEFALTSYKIYPEFSMLLHGVDRDEIPGEWCRYMVVDPGHQVCAVLFAAVPPPDEGNFIDLYDELYLKECNAATFALNVYHKTQGQQFQAFVIDPNGAMITDIGSGKSVMQQYSEHLAARKVASASTGSGFALASDSIEAGVMAVHDLLRRRDGLPPKLRVARNRLPNFEWEIKRYHKKRERGIVTDKPDQKRNNHLMDCLRYLAMSQVRYVQPVARKERLSGAVAAFRAKQERQKSKQGPSYIRLGPGNPSGLDYQGGF